MDFWWIFGGWIFGGFFIGGFLVDFSLVEFWRIFTGGFFSDFWASTPKLEPENKTHRRKFHGESDFQVKNSQFKRPEVKN